MKNLFKCGILNSNSYKILSNSQFLSPRVVQLFYISNLSSKPHKNSKNLGKNGGLNKPGDPLFDEILRIMDTEGIEFDRNSPRVFSAMKDINFEGNAASLESSPCRPKGVCGNDDEKKDHSLALEGSGSRVADEIEAMEVGSIVLKVIEIVRCENALLSMEERLENAGCRYSEEVVVNVLKKCFKAPHLALRFFNWVKLGEGFRHTTNTFNVMINVAGEAEEFGLVEELVEEMGKSSCEKNLKTWTVLVSHYGSRKRIGKALLVFEEMKRAGVEPDAVAYRTMLRALCDARKADLALEFYKDMVRNEVNLDVGLFKQLVKCFALCGNIDAAHLVGEDMIKLEIPKPQVYGIMLKSFCIAGKITQSLELIRDLRNKDISLETGMFEALVRGLCSRDRIADAMEILEIMKRRNVFDQNIYGILISTYLGRNQVSEAFGLFQEAKGYGNVMVSTYTNLMQHCFWKNEFHKGLELYNEMLRLGLRLDSVAITAVAAGYIQQNRISEALEVFKGMNEMGIRPASKSHMIFIKEVCKICKADEVVEALNELQVCKIINLDDILSDVRSYLEKKGEVEKLNAINQMQRFSASCPRSINEKNADHWSNQSELTQNTDTNPVLQRRPACFVESETRLCDCPHTQEVCQILSSSNDWCSIQENLEKLIFQFTPDLVVEVLRSCSLNISIALKFFVWIGKQPDYSHNEQSYNMAMKIAGQGKNFKQMRSLFYEMRRRGCSITADTWTIMIMQYGRTGLTDLALSSFKEMKLSTCKPTKSTYCSLIASLCGKKGRKVDEAIQIYEEMVQAGRAPDKELLEAYVGCLCEVNKLSDVRRCVESLHRFGFSTPLSYSLYVRALCRAGKLDEALALVDEVGCEKNLLQQYTYGSLVHGLLRRGRLEEALGKINCMKQIGFHPTVHVYTSLIIHFLKDRDIKRALGSLEEMKEHGLQPTVVTYSALICGYVRLGKVGDAWEVFRRLKQNGPSPDFRTYSMFIDCLCRAGKSEDAFTLIPEMLRDGIIPSTVNFRTVVYGLNREGKADLAQAVLKKKLDLKRRRHVEWNTTKRSLVDKTFSFFKG